MRLKEEESLILGGYVDESRNNLEDIWLEEHFGPGKENDDAIQMCGCLFCIPSFQKLPC